MEDRCSELGKALTGDGGATSIFLALDFSDILITTARNTGLGIPKIFLTMHQIAINLDGAQGTEYRSQIHKLQFNLTRLVVQVIRLGTQPRIRATQVLPVVSHRGTSRLLMQLDKCKIQTKLTS